MSPRCQQAKLKNAPPLLFFGLLPRRAGQPPFQDNQGLCCAPGLPRIQYRPPPPPPQVCAVPSCPVGHRHSFRVALEDDVAQALDEAYVILAEAEGEEVLGPPTLKMVGRHTDGVVGGGRDSSVPLASLPFGPGAHSLPSGRGITALGWVQISSSVCGPTVVRASHFYAIFSVRPFLPGLVLFPPSLSHPHWHLGCWKETAGRFPALPFPTDIPSPHRRRSCSAPPMAASEPRPSPSPM